MARHIADMPRPRDGSLRLMRFLRLDRRQGAGILKTQARAPRLRDTARKLAAFTRIARQG